MMSLDRKFQDIPTLRWYPWAGLNFKCGTDMMVVCESHYSSKATMQEIDAEMKAFMDDRMATREIVAESFVEHQYSNPTFDNVQKVLVGRTLWRETKEIAQWENLWKNLSFMNVIQRPMKFLRGHGRPSQPTREDFHDGTLALLSVIKILKPRLCFIGSSTSIGYIKNLTRNVNINIGDVSESRIGRFRACSLTLEFDGYKTVVRSSRQPGSYYSWTKWRNYVFNGYADLGDKLSSLLKFGSEVTSRNVWDP